MTNNTSSSAAKKAAKPKRKAKSKFSKKEQSQRLKDAARKFGVGESIAAFESALNKRLPHKRKSKT